VNEQRTPDYRLESTGAGYFMFVAKCPRCKGRGYHHGFGEHGHDPDWCSECGGDGNDIKEVITPWET